MPLAARTPIHGKDLHVLTLTPFYPNQENDAAGCFVAEPLPWMERNGIRHTVIVAKPIYQPKGRTSATATPARWMHYPALPGGMGLASAGAFLLAALISRIRRMHLADPFDIIHAHAALPCGHAAMLLGRALEIPFAITVHGLDAYFDHQVQGLRGKWCRRISQLVYRSAGGVICISEKVREQLSEGLAAAILYTGVIHNGVNPEIFVPADIEGSHLQILSVGNLIPIKGHEVLLRALSLTSQTYPLIRLDIIGEGPERSRLMASAKELNLVDRVRFLGRQPRKAVVAAMQACTIFALPSRYEGLGCVYLEAMSCAKPVIACRGQGIEDVVKHPFNGLLVAPDNPEELAGALDQLLADPAARQRIGASARQTILDNFTFARQAARLRDFYQECLP